MAAGEGEQRGRKGWAKASSRNRWTPGIPLLHWVLEEMSSNPDVVYTDRSGWRNPEYISLGCDTLPVLKGRTPIQVYTNYMRSFRDRFSDYLGNVIAEIQVGLGPYGVP